MFHIRAPLAKKNGQSDQKKKLDDLVKNQNFFKASFRRGLCRTRSGSRNPEVPGYSGCQIRHPGLDPGPA
jgi:hypothetical protein